MGLPAVGAAAAASCSMLMRRSTTTGDGGSGSPSNKSSRPCRRSCRCCLSWESHGSGCGAATRCRLQSPASSGWVGQGCEECASSRRPKCITTWEAAAAQLVLQTNAKPHQRSRQRLQAAYAAARSRPTAPSWSSEGPAGWPAAAGVGGRRGRKHLAPAAYASFHGSHPPLALAPRHSSWLAPGCLQGGWGGGDASGRRSA